MRLHRLLIPLAALLAILPLLVHGPSCGHDFDFHLLSWWEAAHQLSSGHYPRWAYTPAFHAGEPRFLFYPPLSWLLGALLTALLPFGLVPAAYIFCCLTMSGFTMHRLANRFAGPSAATLAADFYLLNPYSLFTAYERSAYAELLAAAWIPLLFAAILRPRPTVRGLAVPLALLWLTNAPAAVMSTYALALLALVRLGFSARIRPADSAAAAPFAERKPVTRRLALSILGGTALGLALPAFYIVPAAYERRWVTINLAILEGLRPTDNFLFHHTPDAGHDAVLHSASLLAVLLLGLAVVFLGSSALALQRRPPSDRIPHYLLPALSALTVVVAFLLTLWSAPLWAHLPELAFLQFPWRTLALVAAVAAVSLAIVLDRFALRPWVLSAVTAALALALIFHPHTRSDPDEPRLTPQFLQGCDTEELSPTLRQPPPMFASTPPTDEYTPTNADNDALHPGDPAFWTIPADQPVDTPPPAGAGPAAGAPSHLDLTVKVPTTLVLNRRVYPAWRITRNGLPLSPEDSRDDGLIALPLVPGRNRIDIRFAETPDRIAGDSITGCALLVLIGLGLRRTVTGDATTKQALG